MLTSSPENIVVLIYAVLFMDWDPKDNPVEEVSIVIVIVYSPAFSSFLPFFLFFFFNFPHTDIRPLLPRFERNSSPESIRYSHHHNPPRQPIEERTKKSDRGDEVVLHKRDTGSYAKPDLIIYTETWSTTSYAWGKYAEQDRVGKSAGPV